MDEIEGYEQNGASLFPPQASEYPFESSNGFPQENESSFQEFFDSQPENQGVMKAIQKIANQQSFGSPIIYCGFSNENDQNAQCQYYSYNSPQEEATGDASQFFRNSSSNVNRLSDPIHSPSLSLLSIQVEDGNIDEDLRIPFGQEQSSGSDTSGGAHADFMEVEQNIGSPQSVQLSSNTIEHAHDYNISQHQLFQQIQRESMEEEVNGEEQEGIFNDYNKLSISSNFFSQDVVSDPLFPDNAQENPSEVPSNSQPQVEIDCSIKRDVSENKSEKIESNYSQTSPSVNNTYSNASTNQSIPQYSEPQQQKELNEVQKENNDSRRQHQQPFLALFNEMNKNSLPPKENGEEKSEYEALYDYSSQPSTGEKSYKTMPVELIKKGSDTLSPGILLNSPINSRGNQNQWPDPNFQVASRRTKYQDQVEKEKDYLEIAWRIFVKEDKILLS